MNLAQLLVRSARVFPTAPALFRGPHLLYDYRALAHRAARMAGWLRDGAGLQAGDRVALFMGNCPEYLEVLWGAWFAGMVVVPINAKLHAKEAEFIIRDSGACALFASTDLAAALLPLLSDLPALRLVCEPQSAHYGQFLNATPAPVQHREADDVAWLFYTSGTTGRPKGVMQTHRNLYAMTSCYFSDVDPVQRADAIVYAAPMSHGAGLYNFPHVLAGARHVVPESGGFDAAELIALARHHRDVSLFAAPTMVKRLVEHAEGQGADPSGFKTIVYGGGPMYVADIKRALSTLGNRLVQIYGQGESPMTITALSRQHLAASEHPRYEARIASVGVAQTLVEVRIADEGGNELSCGETGEILVRGDAVMRGYWNNPQATARTLRGGWLFTGDVGSLDEDGFLTLKDRSKDVIISGGSNIYPREVEEVLLLHPAVREVSVVGRSHPEWGEEVVAFVVATRGSVRVNDLDALCLDHIARFKRPKEYRFVETLPKNNYGKVLKTELRTQLQEEADGRKTEG
jgi:long-chain acyl-CoA synthetase